MAEIPAERKATHLDGVQDYYIQLHHVRKRFGTEEVLKPLDFAVERGKTYGICGNNGSGKTVLMKCICGFLPVTEGLITVGGKRIGYDVDFPESLGVIIETPGFLSNLSGRRNLEILADLRGVIGRKLDFRCCIFRRFSKYLLTKLHWYDI